MKKLKKLLAISLTLVMCLAVFTGCGSKKEEKKVIKVGMEIGYPPFEYYDADGTTPIGVDVDLAKALGEEMGVEFELINTAWDGIFAGLSKGDYDCIISAVTITPDRLLEFDFSDPYIQNYQCIVSLKDSDIKPDSVEGLSGLKVAYQEETASDEYLTDFCDENNMEVETFEYAKVMDCFTDLELGRVDAIICDSTVADGYTADDSSIYEITWIQDSTPEEFGICISKGDTELVEDINEALATLKENGTLDEIMANYF